MSEPARLTDTELEAYRVHADATNDRPLIALVAELVDARRQLADYATFTRTMEVRVQRIEAGLRELGYVIRR